MLLDVLAEKGVVCEVVFVCYCNDREVSQFQVDFYLLDGESVYYVKRSIGGLLLDYFR